MEKKIKYLIEVYDLCADGDDKSDRLVCSIGSESEHKEKLLDYLASQLLFYEHYRKDYE